MPSLKDIRLRIESTKNTQQITKAMKMVSAAKLRRAQLTIVGMRPYAKALRGLIGDIARTGKVSHPLLQRPLSPRRVLLVVVTSDRGLCGAFNTNVNKFAERYLKENRSSLDVVDVIAIGRKGSDFLRRRGQKPVKVILNLAKDISYDFACAMAREVMDAYISGQYEEVRFVYNEFKSAISQTVSCETLLPLEISDGPAEDTLNQIPADMLFEPQPQDVIEQLVQKHFNIQVYRVLCESVAAEHGARMTSMENATKNAGEMIRTLTLTYNKARQAAITTELIEITSGAEALKS